jgi:hypothetical protein
MIENKPLTFGERIELLVFDTVFDNQRTVWNTVYYVIQSFIKTLFVQ